MANETEYTEVEILAGGINAGCYGYAFDTGRYWYRSEDGVTYREVSSSNIATPMVWVQLGTSGVYYVKRNGVVHLRGASASATAVSETLPAEFRPANNMSFGVFDSTLAGSVLATITSVGALSAPLSEGATLFDNISFPAEQ